ncbi:MAG: response regulator [Terracidiphilus sp.]
MNSASRRERIFRTILVADDDPFRAFARCAALERTFYGVTRAASAAEAFIKLEQPAFAANLALVIAGLNLPGLAGPAFVRELSRRLPQTPILALGRSGETAQDYPGNNVRFLPEQTGPADILGAATEMLSHVQAA